jgi:hypothetical protein
MQFGRGGQSDGTAESATLADPLVSPNRRPRLKRLPTVRRLRPNRRLLLNRNRHLPLNPPRFLLRPRPHRHRP